MSDEHVCDYGLRVVSEVGGAYVEVACRCGDELTGAEARRRLNAAGVFSAEHARQLVVVAPLEGMRAFDSLKAYADIREGKKT